MEQVIVKVDRQCARCNKIIWKGTKGRTLSIKYKGRRWYCERCYNNLVDEKEAQIRERNLQERLSRVAFGDEGMAQAIIDEFS